MAVHLEREALLPTNRIHHDRLAVLDQLKHAQPHQVSDPTGHVTDEYTRTDLKKPSGQVTSQTLRAGGQDEHYHGGSMSSP